MINQSHVHTFMHQKYRNKNIFQCRHKHQPHRNADQNALYIPTGDLQIANKNAFKMQIKNDIQDFFCSKQFQKRDIVQEKSIFAISERPPQTMHLCPANGTACQEVTGGYMAKKNMEHK